MKYCSIKSAAEFDAYRDCAEWIGENAMPRDNRSPHMRTRGAKRYEAMTSQRLLAFARAAVHWSCDAKNMLLVVTEYGIWDEHIPLETAVRSLVPGAGTVEEHRCLVASAWDYEHVISSLFVCLAFGRGVLLMNDLGARWFECNHDGRVWVGSNDEADVEKAKSWLDWE